MVSPQMTSPPVLTTATTVPSPPKSAAANYKPNRFGRPCDACKRRKQRCVFRDGQEEVCVMCEFQNVPCTFTDIGIATPQTARKRSNTQSDSTVRKRRQKSNKYVFLVGGESNCLGLRRTRMNVGMGGRVLLRRGLQKKDLLLRLSSIGDRQVKIMQTFLNDQAQVHFYTVHLVSKSIDTRHIFRLPIRLFCPPFYSPSPSILRNPFPPLLMNTNSMKLRPSAEFPTQNFSY